MTPVVSVRSTRFHQKTTTLKVSSFATSLHPPPRITKMVIDQVPSSKSIESDTSTVELAFRKQSMIHLVSSQCRRPKASHLRLCKSLSFPAAWPHVAIMLMPVRA